MIDFFDKFKKNKKVIIGLLLIGIIFFIYHQFLWGDLKKNGILLVGVIKEQSFHSKSSMVDVTYTFEYKGKHYEYQSNSGVVHSPIFIGKTFPVIVSKVTFNSTMLITPNHFKTFNIPFPDSLKWVLGYIK